MEISQLYRNKRKEKSISIPQETLGFFCKLLKGMTYWHDIIRAMMGTFHKMKNFSHFFSKFKKNEKNLGCDFYTIILLIFL